MILIIDFGSQSTHLISRRLKELGADNLILNPDEVDIKSISKYKGIILSGGPSSVYEKNAPTISKELFNKRIPILGICYGQHLICNLLGGEVKQGVKKEYGPADLEIVTFTQLFHTDKDTPMAAKFSVWMSHGDEVKKIPKDFIILAKTATIPYAAISNKKKNIYAIQFHPEVIHTQFGEQILKNFLTICGLTPIKQSIDIKTVNRMIEDIKDSVKDRRAICALSGGVDSSVAAVLVHNAIGSHLTAIYIDSGLMRKDETESLRKVFNNEYKMNVKIIKAEKIFLNNLKGVTDPEKKRKIIGKTFIEVLEKEAKKMNADFLVQGTIYPDVIESAGTKHSQKIKSHHNVGGLPKNMKLMLLEPLRTLYKDEVREVGKLVGLSNEIVKRQPFPGPGLAIRIIGSVDKKKLLILQKADAIVTQEIAKAGLENKLWQAFAVFTGIKTTGVRGDARCYGETIAIRALEARDAMSASWAHLPYKLLDTLGVRIVTEIPEVNRVVYDISNKPPATMEWE